MIGGNLETGEQVWHGVPESQDGYQGDHGDQQY
jgi:hypothetical protein